MDLGAFATALRRRWQLVVAAVVLAVAASTATATAVGPSYETEGSVLLFPPAVTIGPDGTKVESGNPYLGLAGLNTARDILIRAMTSQTQRDQVAESFPRAGYEMVPDVASAGPVIVISASGSSPTEATGALFALLDGVPGQLDALQRGLDIPGSARITSRELTVDERPEVVRKGQVRAAIVAGGAVLVVALLLIGLVDGLLLARRRRQAAEEEEEEVVAAAVEPEEHHDVITLGQQRKPKSARRP